MSKSLKQWLNEYGVSHKNPTNKAIHWVAVPTIYFTVLAMLWSIPVPWDGALLPWLNWGSLAMLPVFVFYWRLSLSLAIGMLVMTLLMCAALLGYQTWVEFPLFYSAAIVFVIAWIFQFIGHEIEGKKPSFFKDLQFLLIGPLWVMHFLYRRWHWPV
ncbi:MULTISPECIES: DUF962 domain-containing protein [Corallincola]|uniref:DUF962 domain-containing protein n=3 Tax=Corallincola TaxID=1775176 RepID=A0A368NSV9_9GAMM|nr:MULTISPECIES: Mpo1-like protein [Corallincola]RCU52559.1 DUF962 domain-containing protein [Corallincola holothuriorum]TAA48249.1 DUF962 domain-containing protein [Corallincola spongiicola]TCI02457.1 DUF962 domain-containing protein [Corallincola luteus]